MTDSELKYWAFLCHSHEDNRAPGAGLSAADRRCWGDWLRTALDSFAIPAEFIGQVNGRGVLTPERIAPVFQAEAGPAADATLGPETRAALEQSKCLVVICSPHSAKSLQVNEVVRYFKQLGRGQQIFPIVIAGEPNAAAGQLPDTTSDAECFVPAIRHPLRPDGTLDTTRRAARYLFVDARHGAARREILATDHRSAQADLETAKIHLIALVLGVGFNGLWVREEKRRFFELAEAREQAREALNQAEEARRQTREVERQVLAIQHLPQDVHHQIEAAQQKALAAQNQAAEIQRQLVEFQGLARDTQSQLAETRARVLAAEARLLEAQTQARDSQHEAEEARRQLQEATSRVLAVEAQAAQAQALLAQPVQAQEVSETSEQVREARRQTEEVCQRLQAVQAQAQAQALAAQNQVQEYQDKARQAESQLADARKQILAAEDSLLAAQNQAREFQQEALEARQRLQEVTNRVPEVQIREVRFPEVIASETSGQVLEARRQAEEARRQVQEVQSQAREAQNLFKQSRKKTRQARRLTQAFAGMTVLALVSTGIAARVAWSQRKAASQALAQVAAQAVWEPDLTETTMDQEQIRQVVDQIVGSPQAANRQPGLNKLAAWIPRQALADGLSASALIPDDQQRSHFQKQLLIRMGWQNPVAAEAAAGAIPGKIVNDDGTVDTAGYFQIAVLDNWLHTDLPGAFQWVCQLPDADVRERALEKILPALAEANLPDTLARLNALNPSPDETIYQQLFQRWTANDPAQAIQQWQQISGHDQDGGILCSILTRWVNQQPQAALDWVNAQPDSEVKNQALATCIAELAKTDVPRALALAESLPEGNCRCRVMAGLMNDWTSDILDGPLGQVADLAGTLL